MNSTLNIRIDKKLKENAGKTLKNMGLDISSGIKMFLCQVVNTKSVPFEPKMHYTMTREQEKWVRKQIADAKKHNKGYKNIKELHSDILKSQYVALIQNKIVQKAIKKYSRNSDFKIEKLEDIIQMIQNEETLDKKYKDHELKGDFQGIRECHVESDLLLLYQIDEENETLFLINMGSHSELFK